MILLPNPKQGKPKRKRKPEISPTKLRVYLTCPLMYKLMYVTRIGRYHYVPNAGDSFGGSLHRALQNFHSSGGYEAHTPEELVTKLRETWVTTGYSSQKEEQEHLAIGERILRDYFASGRTDAVTLFTEKQFKEDMGEFNLVGRIDRLDELPDGTLEIVDYKSGRASVTQQEVADDLAMSIYQLLVRRQYPGRRVIATIHCLRTGVTASAELTCAQTSELEDFVRHTASEMLQITEETEIEPERKEACANCDFLKRICERRFERQ